MLLESNFKSKALLDISSATDIVFLLLIFFMVSFTSSIQQVLKVNLPAANSDSSVDSQGLSIVIDKCGQIFIGQEVVEIDNLVKELRQKMSQKYFYVVIYADKDLPMEKFVCVADIVASQGIKIALAIKNVKNNA